jgi:hypothetical protein
MPMQKEDPGEIPIRKDADAEEMPIQKEPPT